jgi:hypothetical protein
MRGPTKRKLSAAQLREEQIISNTLVWREQTLRDGKGGRRSCLKRALSENGRGASWGFLT